MVGKIVNKIRMKKAHTRNVFGMGVFWTYII